MNVRLLTDDGFIKLNKASEEHPEYYVDVSPNVEDYNTFEYPDFHPLAESYPGLVFPKNRAEDLNESDYQNSLILYRFFSENKFPISLLTDKRFLSYLTHFVYIDYMRVRWATVDVKSKGRIPDRYFWRKGPFGRQGILGLFWPAYLISLGTDDPKVFKDRLHYYFCENRTLRDRIVERKYSKNPQLFANILENIKENDGITINLNDNKKGEAYGRIIQNMLSVTSLDLLEKAELSEILNEQIKIIASGAYDNSKGSGEEDDSE